MVMVAGAAVLLASCTSGNVPPLELAIASVGETTSPDFDDNAFSSGQVIMPDALSVVPSDNPLRSEAVVEEEVAAAEPATDEPPAAEAVATAEVEETEAADNTGSVPTETGEQAEPAPQVAMLQPAPAKKRGFLSALWTPKPAVEIAAKKPANREVVLASVAPAPMDKPEVQIIKASLGGDALPGVRTDGNLFEITRKSGLDDDSDVDLNEDDGSYHVASAAGLARLAPNGLLTQREGVDVACLKPALVGVLKQVERHYGKRVVVTSGYRSPAYNAKARGARNSLHMYCAAADIQIDGVTKWELAKYLRSMPGRGGVGTYCHTNSVHIDVGPERDWNWRCRRRKSSS